MYYRVFSVSARTNFQSVAADVLPSSRLSVHAMILHPIPSLNATVNPFGTWLDLRTLLDIPISFVAPLPASLSGSSCSDRLGQLKACIILEINQSCLDIISTEYGVWKCILWRLETRILAA